MFKNYLITAIRFLKKNRVFAGINTLGLSIALAVSFIIVLFVINELSYDHCHQNRKRIFKVINYYTDFKKSMERTPYVLAPTLKSEFPQVEYAVNTRNVRGFKIKNTDEYIDVNAVGTSSDIFKIFTIPLICGDANSKILEDANSIVLSEKLAGTFYPDESPVGKELKVQVNKEEHVFVVHGVFKDIPSNSTLRAQCFINGKWKVDDINRTFNSTDADVNWIRDFWTTWVLLSKNSDADDLEKSMTSFEKKYISENPKNIYSLQNLSDVYLGSDDIMNVDVTGSAKNIRLFAIIALLIVVVAGLNYIVLSIAVSSSRAKEIGIRKTSGAGNNHIKKQLLSESVLLSFIALPVALLLAWISIPYAGQLFGTYLQVIDANIPLYGLVYLLVILLIGLISGLYTAGYLSRLVIVDVLKKMPIAGKNRLHFRSVLVITQLIIFCSFVSSTLIIRSQYEYALKKDTGYTNSNILLIDIGQDFNGYTPFLNNLKSNPNVITAAGTMEGLPLRSSMFSMLPNAQDENIKVEVEGMAVDYNFIETMGLSIIEGRSFSKDYGSDLNSSAILNETAVRQLGITNPVGKVVGGKTIIGVVKDFNLHSLHTNIPPLSMELTNKYISQIAIYYKAGSLNSLLPAIESDWKKQVSDKPFKYSTIEDINKSLYTTEGNLTKIISLAALFTLLIASLGLFGLTLFEAKARTKEIGIKKTLGCSGQTIIYSFLQKNIVLVLIASVVSIPLTYYLMHQWLNNFSYKVPINGWNFAIALIAASMVVVITILMEAFKASRLNPVEALRYE
jgi:putative ABC transport system permease protein